MKCTGAFRAPYGKQLVVMKHPSVPCEQAVYGSFPFWDRGYAVLAQSPGCRPEWLAELRAACQRYGERPPGAAEAGGLFAVKLASGPWMIVRPSAQGCDDQGRPGALAFHALFVGPADYRRAGYDPFAFAGALKGEWTAETRVLSSAVCVLEPGQVVQDDPRAGPIAEALARRRRVVVDADGPIDALARQVWQRLPSSVRKRATVATWAFDGMAQFDFVARPRSAAGSGDDSSIALYETEGTGAARRPVGSAYLSRTAVIVALSIVGGGLAIGIVLRPARSGTGAAPTVTRRYAAPPDRSHYRDEPSDPDERRRVSEALADATDRFGLAVADRQADPVALMALWAREVRYRGPLLMPEERATLGQMPGHDGALALHWDAHVRRFLDDRPLPDGFARGPLRWQLDCLAWSFHLDAGVPSAQRTAPEVVHGLADALAMDVPVHASSLTGRYPALASYAAFLRRLPTR
ncbi:MAG: hypothetical protein P4L84_02855 [Isosphaeraceae bacterium]|nr:hypothetical protein [Isosphaeraceae bacterium]